MSGVGECAGDVKISCCACRGKRKVFIKLVTVNFLQLAFRFVTQTCVFPDSKPDGQDDDQPREGQVSQQEGLGELRRHQQRQVRPSALSGQDGGQEGGWRRKRGTEPPRLPRRPRKEKGDTTLPGSPVLLRVTLDSSGFIRVPRH